MRVAILFFFNFRVQHPYVQQAAVKVQIAILAKAGLVGRGGGGTALLATVTVTVEPGQMQNKCCFSSYGGKGNRNKQKYPTYRVMLKNE